MPPTAAPFLQLRDSTLGYHGPSDDLPLERDIPIGWFGPTNLADTLNGDLWWAANFAVSEANQSLAASPDPAPGDPRPAFPSLPFRLVPRWAADPWGSGVALLTRMVYDEHPLALLGSVDSASTHLAEQVVAKANLPLVSPMATDKSLTLAGVSWMFSCAPSDAAIARVLVAEILNATAPPSSSVASSPRNDTAGGSRFRLALLACTDHESRLTTREVLREFSRRGQMPAFRFDVSPGARDIARQLNALQSDPLRAVLIVASPEDAARLVRAVRDRLPEVPLFGSHSFGRTRFLELAGSAAEGVLFPLLLAPDLTLPADSSSFLARFKSARGHSPDYAAAYTYDATRLLLTAIRRAGPNRVRVREALAALSPWPGVAGSIHFDGTGQSTRPNLWLGTIRDGAVLSLPAPTPDTQTARNESPL